MVHILDLNFFTDSAIAAFVIETSAGPVLVETGPHSVFPQLEAGLQKLGYKAEDIRHVFLTHIHFDHAGAAWAMAEKGATIYVHPFGWKHMLNPEKLYNSAKRIYQDQMETLWGEMHPIPEEKLIAVEHQQEIRVGDTTFIAHHTPGHANHHIAWQTGDIVFTGDVAGCKISGGPVVPPCPPPDIDIEKWNESLDLLESLKPSELYLTHFGPVSEIQEHIAELRVNLNNWAEWIRIRWEQGKTAQEITPDFQKYAAKQLEDAGLDEAAILKYEAANPAWMSVAGLIRYWSKKNET